MWPLSMGAGDVGHMRSASTASEAVGGCSTLGCFNSLKVVTEVKSYSATSVLAG